MANCIVLEKLANRVIKYLKMELEIDKIQENFSITKVDQLKYHSISAFITLRGDIEGTVVMSVSNEIATIMLENFLASSFDDELIPELLIQTVQEILNITLGNIIQELTAVKQGAKVEISVPYIVNNINYPTKENYNYMYNAIIKCNNNDIVLGYFYK